MLNLDIPLITQEELKHRLTYYPKTGIFKWTGKGRPIGSRIQKGQIAGSVYIQKHNGKKYISILIKKRKYSAHRLAFLYMTGDWPKHQSDHADCNGMNNKWSNLRDIKGIDNERNKRLQSNNSSGISGVQWNPRMKKYQVRIGIGGTPRKRKYLGTFDDFFEACCARKAAELKYGYSKDHGKPRDH